MNEIPIEFDYEGKHYKGYFSEAFGAGGNVWHLMIDNYYYGQLIYSQKFGWAFHNNKDKMKDLADYFAEQIMLWYQ